MPTVSRNSISPLAITQSVLVIGLGAVIFSVLFGSWYVVIAVSLLPFFLILLAQAFQNPFIGVCLLFTFNYYFMAFYRYAYGSGFSVWYDVALIMTLAMVGMYYSFHRDVSPRKYIGNILTIGGIVWSIYTAAEVLNQTADTDAWIRSRGAIYHTLSISLIGVLMMTSYKRVRTIMLLLSVFTLTAIGKAIYQKYVGFDATETRMLIETEMYRTHILPGITRYFSIFTDAGNFGSNMGFAALLFGISAIFIKKRLTRIYFIIIALCSTYALFISGTRGALYVPIGGILFFILLSKNPKLIAATAIFSLCAYLFFAHTYIGESYPEIRRMRTAFRPTEDASYIARRENQKELASYLKHRPFGEGLGLGGVEARKYGERTTTLIPHDSTYVKLWVETGIVGLALFLTIYIGTLLRGCYLIMFRIKNDELRGVLTAIACGIFGLLVSAYGNAFLMQFPTGFMVILFLSVLVNGEHIDRALAKRPNATPTVENK